MKNFILLLVALFFVGCAATQYSDDGYAGVNNPEVGKVYEEDIGNPVNLSDYLNRIAGVSVTGNGANAQVRVRGPISFSSNESPLFVVNGSKIGHSYAQIYNSINVRDIKSVRVLKNESETAIWGLQAAGGVVLIKLKD